MIDAMTLLLGWVAGLALGGLFFGGLWWSLQRALTSTRPALWFVGSFLVRTSLALTGFYFVGGSEWPRLLACLAGFIMARVVVTRLTRVFGGLAIPSQEVHHAS